MHAIRCSRLVKRYPDGVVAVDGLDLEIQSGECFGLLGPNGAGKTTTVEILEGLLAKTSGDVEVLGRRWETDERALRERIGVSLQQTNLPDKLRVREIVALFAALFAKPRKVDDVIRLVSLEDKARSSYETLSGGQKQRLAVACAVIGNPDLVFLDEPTTGLDPQSRRQLWDLVLDFKASGHTVLLTTHYMDEAERLCDRVAVIDHGKAIALGSPQELIASLGGQEMIEFSLASGPPLALGDLERLAGVHSAAAEAGGFVLAVEMLHKTLPDLLTLLAGRPLASLRTHRATLEDVFVRLTGRHLRD
jgi:ABC-2 type transport system ATP-binding protein